MKKTIAAMALGLMALAAGAQTMSDALLFSTNNYYGTARTIGLGNAVTAVGGDLGTIGINPAGSAVASYSQFAFTTGLDMASVNAAYSNSGYTQLDAPNATYSVFGDFSLPENTRKTRLTMPNIGVVQRYETGNIRGIRAVTWGVVSNSTNYFTNHAVASGRNGVTSMLSAFAAQAQYNADGYGARLNPNVYEQSMYDPYNNPYKTVGGKDYYYNWNVLAGYDAYMFGDDDGDGMYSAATQDESLGTDVSNFPVAGVLDQTSALLEYGNKHDLIMNVGLDINDRLYLGFNIGIPSMKYVSQEYFRETAENSVLFPTAFQTASYRSEYRADATGLYAKIGFIGLPTDNLRVGASIQTPASMTIDESWTVSAATLINGHNASASDVPTGAFSYCLRTPYIVDAGIAYTIASRALLSVDYEMIDYSVMKFGEVYYDYYDDPVSDYSTDAYVEVNTLNRLFCGPSHALRAGVEFRVTPMFSLRGGYNYVTNPRRYYTDVDDYVVDADYYDYNFDFYYYGGPALLDKRHLNAPTKSYSFGAGFSSNGSFFADFAARLTQYPVAYMGPYSTYYKPAGDYVSSPLVRRNRNVFDLSLTLGWRF